MDITSSWTRSHAIMPLFWHLHQPLLFWLECNSLMANITISDQNKSFIFQFKGN